MAQTLWGRRPGGARRSVARAPSPGAPSAARRERPPLRAARAAAHVGGAQAARRAPARGPNGALASAQYHHHPARSRWLAHAPAPLPARAECVGHGDSHRAERPKRGVWAADFKGEFRLTDGTWCYPLTVSDLHSRYVLAVRALASTAGDPATAALRACFAEFGLPRVIRTANAVPFCAPLPLGGLSPLASRWIRLRILPE